jgi:hypothetical protein
MEDHKGTEKSIGVGFRPFLKEFGEDFIDVYHFGSPPLID